MKKRETYPGKAYAVTTQSGCSVYADEAGAQLIKTIEAGQGYFVAIGSQTWFDDDTAIITETFNVAPQQKLAILGVLGGGDTAWFKALREELTAMLDGSTFETAWLAEKKQLIVHTDRVDDAMMAAVKATAEAAMPEGAVLVQYNHNIEISWRDINKYAACATGSEMVAVNANCKNDLTSDGEWVYPLPELWKGEKALSGSLVTKFAIDLPKLTNWDELLNGCPKLVEIRCNLPKCTALGNAVRNSPKLKIFDGYMQKVTDATNAFSGCAVRVFTSTLPALAAGGGMFSNCELEKEYVVNILNSLQTATSAPTGWMWKMTIGIHVDNKPDAEVLAAIAAAEEKGWTLTVQWNGTPTANAASTYGLRTPPIYARVVEDEYGKHLDWGHYVTDTTGYEEFRSVDSARAYFGIEE